MHQLMSTEGEITNLAKSYKTDTLVSPRLGDDVVHAEYNGPPVWAPSKTLAYQQEKFVVYQIQLHVRQRRLP